MLSLLCLTLTVILSINGALEYDNCFGHGECRVNQGNPTCYCFAGYIGKQCENKTSITLNDGELVESDNIFSFRINDDDNILYDLDFMHNKSYSFQDEQGETHIDLHFDLQTTSITLFDSVLANQGVTLVDEQYNNYNSTRKTKINLLCPSDIDVSVDANNIFYKYQIDTEYELNLFTPLACPISCISYNDETNKYQQCNGRGICSFDPTIQQTHCLCQDGYDSASQCAISSIPTRRRLWAVPPICIKKILKEHNDIRGKIRTGEFTWSPSELSRPIQTFPKPADGALPDLKWNNDLANQASSWVDLWPKDPGFPNQLMQHSPANIGKPEWDHWEPSYKMKYGENIGFGGRTIDEICGAGDELGPLWFYGELKWYLWGTYRYSEQFVNKWNEKYYKKPGDQKAIIGHLTQVIWGDTTEIGCGYYQHRLRRGTHKITIVCQYLASGNHPGQEPYRTTESAPRTDKLKSREDPEIVEFKEFLAVNPEDQDYKGSTMTKQQFEDYCSEAGFRSEKWKIQIDNAWRAMIGKHRHIKSSEILVRQFPKLFDEVSASEIEAHTIIHKMKSASGTSGSAMSSAGPSKSTPPTLKVFQSFLKDLKNIYKKKKMNRGEFIEFAQHQGFNGYPYNVYNLGRFWDSIFKSFDVTHISTKVLIIKFKKVTIPYLQSYFSTHAAHVEKYDNYYNDGFYDGKMDKSDAVNTYNMDPYFYAQFEIFNFVEILLQSLILVFLCCICGGFVLFIIYNATKRNKSNNDVGYDAIDQV